MSCTGGRHRLRKDFTPGWNPDTLMTIGGPVSSIEVFIGATSQENRSNEAGDATRSVRMTLDWMHDSEFVDEIKAQVSKSAGGGGMKQYRTAIVDRLSEHLARSKQLRESEELRKAASERRGKQDALEAVDRLVKEASRIASADGRDTVTAEDFDQSYTNQSCTVWPFC